MKRSIIYVTVTFLLTWGIIGALWATGNAQNAQVRTLVFAACMFMPSLGNVCTRLFTKEGFRNLHVKMKVRGNVGTLLLAGYFPLVLTALGAAVYFMVFPGQFDGSGSVLIVSTGLTGAPLWGAAVATLLLCPLVNLIPTLGEEFGWRGYLQFHLEEKLPRPAAILLTGVIWGVWHAPMIALGHNYGREYWGYPITGILLFTLFCVAFGSFCSYVAYKTGSCIPAAMAHSTLNAMGAAPIYFTQANAAPNILLGPMTMGLLAMVPTLICGAVCLMLCKKAAQNAV